MDIRPLLRAHAEWVVHLREYIYGSGELDVRVILRDDECELGRWLYGEAARYHHLPEYETARLAHAAFHADAAQVVRLVQAGRRHEAGLEIGHGGRLRKRSAMMVRSFVWLNQRLETMNGDQTGGFRGRAAVAEQANGTHSPHRPTRGS